MTDVATGAIRRASAVPPPDRNAADAVATILDGIGLLMAAGRTRREGDVRLEILEGLHDVGALGGILRGNGAVGRLDLLRIGVSGLPVRFRGRSMVLEGIDALVAALASGAFEPVSDDLEVA